MTASYGTGQNLIPKSVHAGQRWSTTLERPRLLHVEAAGAAGPVPALRRGECSQCGLAIWITRLEPGPQPRRGKYLFLEPASVPGGGVSISPLGMSRFVSQGDYRMHRCPERVVSCKYCGEPVRVLHQPPGAAEALAVLDAEPDPRSTVVITYDGYAVYDPGHAVHGARYRWHTKHAGGAR